MLVLLCEAHHLGDLCLCDLEIVHAADAFPLVCTSNMTCVARVRSMPNMDSRILTTNSIGV